MPSATGESSEHYRQISGDDCCGQKQSREEGAGAGLGQQDLSRVVRAGLTGKVVLEPGLEEVSSMDNDGGVFWGKP